AETSRSNRPRQEAFSNSRPDQNPENTVSEARRASPSPSEAAIYVPLSGLARGFRQNVEPSTGGRLMHSRLPPSARRYIGAQAFGLLGGGGDLAFHHVADGDHPRQAAVLQHGQMANPTVGHARH